MSSRRLGRWSRRRLGFSALLIGAFVAGTTLGPTFVSAANTAIQNVFITNAALPVTGTVAISGTVQTGASTVVIASGSGTVAGGGRGELQIIPPTDVRAYKRVTVYVGVFGAENGSQTCFVNASPDVAQTSWYAIDSFTAPELAAAVTRTIDPAPPVIQVTCGNNSAGTATYQWMLTGRSN